MKYADSTLMSFTKKDLIGIIRCLEHNVESVEEMNANQFALLMEKEKYSWHDLRKNPEDLPKVEKQYLVAWQDGTYDFLWFAYVDGYGYDWQVAYFPDVSSIIGWKEIEPFEGVEL